MILPPDKLGELIASSLSFGAIVLKLVSDHRARQVEEEEESGLIVIEQTKLDRLIAIMEQSGAQSAGNTEDMLACMGLTNILLGILGQDRKLLLQAEDQIFAFLRHADFPGRELFTATFELAIAGAKSEAGEHRELEQRAAQHRHGLEQTEPK